jgi:hypothetical protein
MPRVFDVVSESVWRVPNAASVSTSRFMRAASISKRGAGVGAGVVSLGNVRVGTEDVTGGGDGAHAAAARQRIA